MRKYIRNIMRYTAKNQKAKPSQWVKITFENFQRKKHGSDCRKRNQAKGTHPRHLWASRIAMIASH